MRLRYGDLTKEQKEFICNGCGSKGGWIKPPNFLFLASCNHHDFKYYVGCTELDFENANDEFYSWMKKDIKMVKGLKKYYFYLWAFSYYKAVSIFGRKYFNFNTKRKTLSDLRKELKDATQ